MPTTESTSTTDTETPATVVATPDATEPTAAQPDTGDLAAEAAKWKALARKHEDQAKANADKARRLDALEEAAKSEQQKLTEAAEKARKEAADTAAELARMKAAVKHGLAEADLELLANVPADQVEARAELLAARLKGAIPQVAPATALGNVGTPVHETGDQIKDLDARIAEADKARNFALAIQLKRQRAALAGAKN